MTGAGKPAYDPHRFVELARRVGHGKALGLEYRDSGPNWMELCLPWREELVGVSETGVLASGAIVSLIDTASGASVWMMKDRAGTVGARVRSATSSGTCRSSRSTCGSTICGRP